MTKKPIQLAIILIAMVFLMSGCGRDNGLPNDLTIHLAAHGIQLRTSGSDAPLSSRAGFVFFDHDPDIEANIIAEFDLKKIGPQDQQFSVVSRQVGAKPTGLWGIVGRPAKLKLRNGAQFEYLYLLTTVDGRTYLLAEYAYG